MASEDRCPKCGSEKLDFGSSTVDFELSVKIVVFQGNNGINLHSQDLLTK